METATSSRYCFSYLLYPLYLYLSLGIKRRLQGSTLVIFTSIGYKRTLIVTWFVARPSRFRYNRPTKQAKMAKLSRLYQNLKKSYLWPTGSNFDNRKLNLGSC